MPCWKSVLLAALAGVIPCIPCCTAQVSTEVCDPGKWYNRDFASCRNCPPNTYNLGVLKTCTPQPTSCGPGTYFGPAVTTASRCVPCAANHYLADSSHIKVACLPQRNCGMNQRISEDSKEELRACSACPAGQFQPERTHRHTECNTHTPTVAPSAAPTTQTYCAANERISTAPDAETGMRTCAPCFDGQYQDAAGHREVFCKLTPRTFTKAATLPGASGDDAGWDEGARQIAVSADARIVVGPTEGAMTTSVWEVEFDEATGAVKGTTLLATLPGTIGEVHGVAVSGDARLVVTGSDDAKVTFWRLVYDVDTGGAFNEAKVLRQFDAHSNAVRAVAVSADGRLAVSASDGGRGTETLTLWGLERDAGTGEFIAVTKLAPLEQHHTDHVCSVAVTPDARIVVTGSHDNTAKVWRVHFDAGGRAIGARLLRTLVRMDGDITSVAVSADGRVVFATHSRIVSVWSIQYDATQESVVKTRQLTKLRHKHDVDAVAVNSDGRFVVAGSGGDEGAETHVWELRFTLEPETGAIVKVTSAPLPTLRSAGSSKVRALAVSTDFRKIVAGLNGGSGQVELWLDAQPELSSRYELTLTMEGTNPVRAVALATNRVVTGSNDSTGSVWCSVGADDCTPGDHLAKLAHPGIVLSVAANADASVVVTGAGEKGSTAKVWRRKTDGTYELGTEVKGHGDDVTSVALSADAATLVTGSIDSAEKKTKVWDLGEDAGDHELRIELGWHTVAVRSVALSPDARMLVTADKKGHVNIWTTSLGSKYQLLKELTTGYEAFSVALSADKTTVVAGFKDDTARVWRLSDGGRTASAPILLPHGNVVFGVAVNFGGTIVASVGKGGNVKIWRVAPNGTGVTLLATLDHPNDVNAVAMSDDARTIATGCRDRKARVYVNVPASPTPTAAPTASPTAWPTTAPTRSPTAAPTAAPSTLLSNAPTSASTTSVTTRSASGTESAPSMAPTWLPATVSGDTTPAPSTPPTVIPSANDAAKLNTSAQRWRTPDTSRSWMQSTTTAATSSVSEYGAAQADAQLPTTAKASGIDPAPPPTSNASKPQLDVSDSKGGGSNSTGTIVGVVMGVLVALLLIGLAVLKKMAPPTSGSAINENYVPSGPLQRVTQHNPAFAVDRSSNPMCVRDDADTLCRRARLA